MTFFWRFLEKNYHEPPWTTTKPPQKTTMNHYKPPQSLIQNEIWYWILDSDWLNSGSHDIFLRILEKNYYEPARTTMNHHKPPQTTRNHYKPLRTTTNHHKPLRTTTNHHEPSRSLIQNEIWYWILDSDWLNSGSHDIFLRILEKNHHKTSQIIMNHHKKSRNIWNYQETSQIITNHHETSRITTNLHQSSWNITRYHETSWIIMNHHKTSWTIMNHPMFWLKLHIWSISQWILNGFAWNLHEEGLTFQDDWNEG